jgi:hypothetical protein
MGVIAAWPVEIGLRKTTGGHRRNQHGTHQSQPNVSKIQRTECGHPGKTFSTRFAAFIGPGDVTRAITPSNKEFPVWQMNGG